jgi:hypothetical protein
MTEPRYFQISSAKAKPCALVTKPRFTFLCNVLETEVVGIQQGDVQYTSIRAVFPREKFENCFLTRETSESTFK